MALTGPETALQGMADRLAYLKAAIAYLGIGGTRMFARADASADEAFEIRIAAAAHAADDALGRETAAGTIPLGDIAEVRDFADAIAAYCKTDAGYASLDAYLTAKGWRVDQRFAEILQDQAGRAVLSAANVGGAADAGASAPGQVLGNLTRGGALVAGTDMDATVCSGSPIRARVTALGTADWTLSVTAKVTASTTKVVAQVVNGTSAGGAVGDTYILGAQAIGGSSAAGQKVVTVAATGQFTVGQKVLLSEFSGSAPDEVWTGQEVAEIASIQENASLTMVANLKHSYTTSGFAYPIFLGVSAASGTGGSASDRVYFYPAAERRLKL